MRSRAIVATAVLTLLLSGCGFHLRRTPLLTQYHSVCVVTPQPYSVFARELKQRLQQQRVCVQDSCQSVQIALHIDSFSFQHDRPTISNSSTARVYRYTLSVDYHLCSPNGQPIGPIQHITASRFTTLNAGILTTTNNQVSLLQMGLIDDALGEMIRRLAAQRLPSRAH